jgi:hypothetical protein
MSDANSEEWSRMDTAPMDGTRILAQVRASEQGPAAVDVVRWGRPEDAADACWISDDSEPGCLIVYAEIELTGWMPLTDVVPRLRSDESSPALADASEEIAGSGI